MDAADAADALIEEQRMVGIMQARRAPALRPWHRCHYCGEPVDGPLLFCDQDCAQDFENEEEQLKRMGQC